VAVKVTKLPDEPILHLQLVPPSEPLVEAELMERYINETAPLVDGMLYVISDFSHTELSFSDVVVGMAEFSRNTILAPDAVPFMPVLVGSSAMVTLIAHAARDDQYGHLDLPRFVTVEEALIYIRSLIGAPTLDWLSVLD
jgi:hypothetical protein